ncbi:MAG: hypothetical protein IKK84_03715 [Clostridia bacterium]|nr:hypothetical protein [Clostridia bacterium]MBR6641103.1 hypothetical protein [Clostridia bacterium]
MQQKTLSMKVPVGIKAMAEMMAMEEVEVRFFPKLDDLRSLLKDYNFGTLTKRALVEKLEALKAECLEENFDTYADGIGELIKAIQYRY